MRLDLFLANLIYGITFLTTAMAFAHFLGGVIPGIQPGRARGWLRILVSACSISLALVLLHFKATGGGNSTFFQSWFSAAAPQRSETLVPRLLLSQLPGDGERAPAPEAEPALDSSWTMAAVRTPELISSLRQLQLLDAGYPDVFSLMGSQSGWDCKAWEDELRGSGLPVQDSTGELTWTEHAVLLVCAGDERSAETWSAVKEHVRAGGALLVIGEPNPFTQGVLKDLLGAGDWKDVEVKGSTSIGLGGPLLGYGGFPAGIRLEAEGGGSRAFLEAEGESRLFAADAGAEAPAALTNLALERYGNGRVAWTTLPPQLYGKLRALYGDAWRLLNTRVLAFLGRLPQLGLELWPAAAAPPALLAVEADSAYGNAARLASWLASERVPASFYSALNEALADRRTTAAIEKSGFEAAFASAGRAEADAGAQFERAARMTESQLMLGRSAVRALATSREETAPAALFAAASRFQFDYAYGAPFDDDESPYEAGLFRSADLRDAFGAGRIPVAADAKGSLTVLPSVTRDDRSFVTGGSLDTERRIIDSAVQDFRRTQAMGTPFSLRVHTRILGEPSNRQTLSRVLAALREAGARFESARSIVDWWKTRSRVSIAIEAPKEAGDSPDEFEVTLRNESNQRLEKAVLRMTEPEEWSLVGLGEGRRRETVLKHASESGAARGMRVFRFELPALAPAETLRFKLARQKG